MLHRLFAVLFPPKCVLCRDILPKGQFDLCHHCRETAPVFTKSNFRYSFIARWTSVWYYKDTVRKSLLRYKFGRVRSYAAIYGRLLAMKLQTTKMDDFDVLTWVPISRLRRFSRGFDQVELIAQAVACELDVPAVATLQKTRHNPPQSQIPNAAARRANVLGAYRAIDPEAVHNKRVLLLDDIITTGATVSECAKMLTMAGAAEVFCAAVASTNHNKNDYQYVGETP